MIGVERMMQPTFTYVAADLRTNVVLAELPVGNPQFSSALGKAGVFTSSVQLGDPRAEGADLLAATEPKRVALYVDYGGTLVWGGIIWARDYDSTTKQLTITAGEFWSFFEHQIISQTLRFDQVDQLDIFRWLLLDTIAQDGGDIGLEFPMLNLSGRLRDRTYYWYDLKNTGEACRQLSEVIDGFEFSIDLAWGASGPRKLMNLFYPTRGNSSSSALLIDYPGNIQQYQWPEDGSNDATKIHAAGVGEGETMLYSSATDTTAIAAGYPLLQDSYAYKDISIQATLDEHAEADLAYRGQTMKTAKFEIRASLDPVLGSYGLGDYIRVRITDERFPAQPSGAPGKDDSLRILGLEVTPDEDRVVLTLGNLVER